MVKFLFIIAIIVIEILLGFLIIKNPNKFVGEGKSETAMKVFVFLLLSIMIISLLCLTLSRFIEG